MSEVNLQTWKVPFTAEIWKDKLTHAVIDKSYEIKLNEFTIFLEPIKKEKISGYFLFEFSNEDNSTNSAEAKTEELKQNEFENFKRSLLLRGLNLEVIWGKIEPIGLPPNHLLHTSSHHSFSYKVLNTPISFLDEDIHSVEKTYDKIQKNKNHEYINNILNLLTTLRSNEQENFFYKWISFNQIYSYDSSDNESERTSIEKLAEKYSEFSESPYQIKNKDDFFTLLSNKDHFNKNKSENFSEKLRKAISKEEQSNIWKYSFLCIYSIRNEFFHGGKDHEQFDKLSEFLVELVLTSLNNIFELK